MVAKFESIKAIVVTTQKKNCPRGLPTGYYLGDKNLRVAFLAHMSPWLSCR